MSLKRLAFFVAALLILGVAGGVLWVRLGIYNIAATEQHTAPVFWLLQEVKKWSVRQRAEEISAPDLSSPRKAESGLRLYQRHCLQCHGAPGIARGELGRGMTPVPTNLVQAAREWTAEEIFWAVKHGIKMTGMPAWDYRMPDDQIWDIVAFVKKLPSIAPAAYRDLVAEMDLDTGSGEPTGEEEDRTDEGLGGSTERGKVAIRQYACMSCHKVPGIVGTDARVGPPLRGMGSRKYIAGVLPNTTENMVLWLRDPRAVDPLTGMPDLGVTATDAEDMAAYIATLKD